MFLIIPARFSDWVIAISSLEITSTLAVESSKSSGYFEAITTISSIINNGSCCLVAETCIQTKKILIQISRHIKTKFNFLGIFYLSLLLKLIFFTKFSLLDIILLLFL